MNLQRGAVLVLGLMLLAVPALAAPVVLFDQGHGQRFLVGKDGELDLSRLGQTLSAAGLTLKVQQGPLDATALSGVQGLVISGPFAPLTAAEIAAVRRYVEDGGRLVVLLHIGPTLSGLLREFGVYHSNGVIRESEQIIEQEPLNFAVTRLKPHPLFKDLSRFNLYGGWALDSDNPMTEVIASSGPQSWVDLNNDKQRGPGDAVQSFGVAVAGRLGRGEFVVFGDDAIFQNRFIKGENEALAANLARWLSE